mmetsp:Transcript_42214/g.132981  ORF Transcript_42214/g.132981 Transcript_42214/m.132981 type:complete len:225 (+) Transcript_42214:686-1360(+)
MELREFLLGHVLGFLEEVDGCGRVLSLHAARGVADAEGDDLTVDALVKARLGLEGDSVQARLQHVKASDIISQLEAFLVGVFMEGVEEVGHGNDGGSVFNPHGLEERRDVGDASDDLTCDHLTRAPRTPSSSPEKTTRRPRVFHRLLLRVQERRARSRPEHAVHHVVVACLCRPHVLQQPRLASSRRCARGVEEGPTVGRGGFRYRGRQHGTSAAFRAREVGAT